MTGDTMSAREVEEALAFVARGGGVPEYTAMCTLAAEVCRLREELASAYADGETAVKDAATILKRALAAEAALAAARSDMCERCAKVCRGEADALAKQRDLSPVGSSDRHAVVFASLSLRKAADAIAAMKDTE